MKMRHLMIPLYFFLYSQGVCAQDSKIRGQTLLYTLTGGFGAGGGYPGEDGVGISGSLELAVQTEKSSYGIGVHGVTELIVFNPEMKNAIGCAEILYSRSLKRDNFFASAGAGIGMISGTNYIGYGFGNVRFSGLGFPISLKGIFRRSRSYGLGIELYLNLNNRSNFYCVQFSQQIRKQKK